MAGGLRVLVVEDSPDLRPMIAEWLVSAGVAVEVRCRTLAGSVSDADIDWCDAVLADYMLPAEDGCALLARVAERRPEVRRVLWTADETARCEHAHVRLVKPTDIANIKDAFGGY